MVGDNNIWKFIIKYQHPLRAFIAIISTVLVAGIVAMKISDADINAEFRTCHRINILRSLENNNSLVDYHFEIQEVNDASNQVTKNRLNGELDKRQWVGLSICHDVVIKNHKPPDPVYFRVKINGRYVEHLPPRSALVVGPEN